MTGQFPSWIKKRIPADGNLADTRRLLEGLGLNTVCQSACCPNLGECFARKTATFMIMGGNCTRNCSFCAVSKGVPGPLEQAEPMRVAGAVEKLGIRHAVITSVTRDDLADGGAGHFARCIGVVRENVPGVVVEVLTPDFGGSATSIDCVVAARPDIYNHNLETVPRLYPRVRPLAGYGRSLGLLERVKVKDPAVYTKSGLMVGFGETMDEIRDVFRDLRGAGCDIVTVGQYLRPSPAHLEVAEYVRPEVFEEYRLLGKEMGFLYVASAPFVRSSFHAHEFSDLFIKEGCSGGGDRS